MLTLILPEITGWDEEKEEFFLIRKAKVLNLEHSLVSISKWESKWHKPFLTKNPKTIEETIDYIRCMTLTQNVSEEDYLRITNEHVDKVNSYIEDPMTAAWFSDDGNRKGVGNRETITNELIYYWMISLNIPDKCEKWHLNRLLTLIRVCNEKNKPPKKRSRSEMINSRRALNNERKRKLKTKG